MAEEKEKKEELKKSSLKRCLNVLKWPAVLLFGALLGFGFFLGLVVLPEEYVWPVVIGLSIGIFVTGLFQLINWALTGSLNKEAKE